jgi:hypothetical protein
LPPLSIVGMPIATGSEPSVDSLSPSLVGARPIFPTPQAGSPVQGSMPSMPEIQISYPQVSSPALRAPTSPGGSTRLGVPPPPVRVSRSEIAMPTAKRENRLWLVVGALLAIAAGIALAIVIAT